MNSRATTTVLVLLGGVALYQHLQLHSMRRELREAADAQPASSAGRERRGGAAHEEAELRARIDDLDGRVLRLSKLVLDQKTGGGNAESTAREVEALRADVENIALAGVLESDEGRTRLREAIRREQDSVEVERREERWKRMQKEQDERIARFVDEAKLSSTQADSLTNALTQEREQTRDLFASVQDGSRPFSEARNGARDIRHSTDDAMKQTLSTDQYAAYEQMRDDSSWGWGGGGGGGGGAAAAAAIAAPASERVSSMSAAAPLAALLPGPGAALSASDILDRFVAWVAGTGLSLYEAQEEAVLAILDGKHVVLSTPTGSGKSLVATFLHFKCMAEGKRSFYTCPIKALVNEKFFALCEIFGAANVGMMTGDAAINRDAPIICCTAEILANLAIRENAPPVDAVVMDEFHYYADAERGTAWQVPLLVLEKATFLLLSATLGDTTAIEEGIREVTGREAVRVRSTVRPVPLEFEYSEEPLHETLEKLVASGRAPVYLVNFTQRAAAEQAQNLMSVNFSSKDEKESIRVALQDVAFTTPYGKEFQRFIRHGIGLHHAGLLPKYRLTVERLAQAGLLKVISGTDTLGMGINIPLKTVLFTQLCKFDGKGTAILSARDFHQISGRAGRKGFDDVGYVLAQAPEHVIENKKLEAKAQSGRKIVKKQPPAKGYVPWDRATFEKLRVKEPEKLESRFDVTFGLLLSALQSGTTRRGGGYGLVILMIARSHHEPHVKRKLRRTASRCFRALREAGLVEIHRVPGGPGSFVRPARDLQREFSLHQTLSLYLLDSLGRISPEVETYAMDVLSQVEAILEDPDVVLYKQLDRLKGEKVMELKRAGVDYDDRMAELEKLEYPKPNRDFVYATFNEFAAKHPWVGAENIRPKSVAREMLERLVFFDDYVRDYGLERSEGVLLRYLSQVYKALTQTVPESIRTDEIEDAIAGLRAMIRGVDSSLLDEWERMADPSRPVRALEPGPSAPAIVRISDLASDPRAFGARVRTDLHALLRALAAKRWDAACEVIRSGEWDAARVEAAMAPYFAEHASIVVTPAARRPHNTHIKPAGPRRWDVSQTIVPPEGEADWAIECDIDLSEGPSAGADGAPILSLRRIGT